MYEISYANAMLFSKATPTYDDYKEEKKFDKSLDANNPANAKNFKLGIVKV